MERLSAIIKADPAKPKSLPGSGSGNLRRGTTKSRLGVDAILLVSTVVTTDLRVVVPVRTCFDHDRTGSDSSHLQPLRGA